MPTDKEVLYSDYGYSFTPAETSTWQALIDKWRRASNDFDIAVAQLQQRMASPEVQANPELLSQAQALWDRAQSIAPKVTAIRAAVDDVLAAMSGAWDSVSGAWQSAMDWIGLNGTPDDEGLGVVQFLIPAAAVLAAIALITAFLTDYAKFAKNADVYTTTLAKGGSIDDAKRAVAAIQTPGVLALGVGGVPLWLIALGGFGLYLYLGNKKRSAS